MDDLFSPPCDDPSPPYLLKSRPFLRCCEAAIAPFYFIPGRDSIASHFDNFSKFRPLYTYTAKCAIVDSPYLAASKREPAIRRFARFGRFGRFPPFPPDPVVSGISPLFQLRATTRDSALSRYSRIGRILFRSLYVRRHVPSFRWWRIVEAAIVEVEVRRFFFFFALVERTLYVYVMCDNRRSMSCFI